MNTTLYRRHYLAGLAAALMLLAVALAADPTPKEETVAFFLIGDTHILASKEDPTKLDDKMFKGKAMTYYGRWTYKYEIASQKGLAAPSSS